MARTLRLRPVERAGEAQKRAGRLSALRLVEGRVGIRSVVAEGARIRRAELCGASGAVWERESEREMKVGAEEEGATNLT